jgi:tRNA A58 N-methylase Trm61
VSFSLNDEELAFLGSHVWYNDTVFEYGSGKSTAYLAPRCKRLITVEHKPEFAAVALLQAHQAGHGNVTVISAPPVLPYVEGTDDDGDLSTFGPYVDAYTGKGVNVVLIDGRARCEVIRHILETASYGPSPDLKIFVHDINRPAYADALARMDHVQTVGRLGLYKARFE